MPEFIHERPGWPDLTWNSAALAAPLAALRHKQGRLLGQMEALGFDLRSDAGVAVLTGDVVKSSAIEGESLPPGEVRSSVARRLGLDAGGLPKASRHVDSVVAMALDATRNFAAPLTRERLFGWHSLLFPDGRNGMGAINVGAWRTGEAGLMRVVSGPIGREKVHYVAPAAERLEAEMARFLAWFEGAAAIDPVLVAGVAHFWFVTIHPFADGNGRIARAIADLALARADGSSERYCSMSSQIAAERSWYYLELETAQRGDLDLTRWLAWFLGCLDRAVDGARELLAGVLRKARLRRRLEGRPIHDRQRLVLDRLLDGFEGLLSTSKYAKLANCSPDTALRDVQELVALGVLVRNAAGGRSTSYRLAES